MNGDSVERAHEVIRRCRKLASFSEDAGSTRRTFLSEPMRDCHREISQWLEPLGASVTTDAAGNLRAVFLGADPRAPRLLLGSHLDTVPNAGAFDGVLGVVLAVALMESLAGRELPFGIEVIGFSEEEGVRFGVPFLGSRALVGTFDEGLLRRQDAHGVSVRQALEAFGLDPSQIPSARLEKDVFGYVEFHIEQGPVLEDLGRPLGVVEAIVGQTRMAVTFVGRANHAGTTPMHLRRDALAAAAEWIVKVENEARREPGLVATVGAIHAVPGAANVVAGEASALLDVRHRSDDVRARTVERLMGHAKEIASSRDLSLRQGMLLNHATVPMDRFLADQIEHAIRQAGCEPHRMVSGAGHDAMILAERVPTAMVFLRTPNGISHDPAEAVLVEDVAKAIDCGLYLLTAPSLLPGRPCRA
jgi:allantoate deiminase